MAPPFCFMMQCYAYHYQQDWDSLFEFVRPVQV